ncbi:MAG: CBS domain-containing protein [Flavobacteriales bacterium]|jgi:predicted transcriptional regulator|nr:CBS domain-containing protein [Flavobacteriales bacterium]
MLAKEIIINTIPPIKPNESGEKALNWMDEFKVIHLPVVRGKEYLGLISDNVIYDQNDATAPLENMNIAYNRPFVYADSHIYEVMKVISELNLTLVPILDRMDNYIGCTTLSKITSIFTNSSSITEPGAIIILDINKVDYSLAQIAQIIEGNDTKILSSYITSSPDSNKMEVTIKVNREHIGGVLQTLNRYNYVVKAYFTQNKINDNLKERYQLLLTYLNT